MVFCKALSIPAEIFIISIVHVTCQWAIGDSVRITRGENENRRGVIFHLHQDGFLQLYDTNTTFSDEQLHSFKVRCSDVDFDDRWTDMATKLPFAGWSQGTATTDQPVSSALPFSSPDKSQRGFQGIEVMVAKPADFIVPSRETKGFSDAGTQGFIVIPHKGFIGIIIGDFDSQERSDRLKKAALDSLVFGAEEVNHGKQLHHKSQSRTGKLLKPEESTYTCLRDPDVAGIMVTIQGDHSLETVHVPIEHSPIEAPSTATPKKDQLLRNLQLPPWRMRRYGLRSGSPPLEGEDTGLWLCLPELTFKRLDVQVIGIATLKLKKTSAAVRNCEGRKGMETMHPIDKSCVKPLRTDDEGHPLGETAQRVVVIGPDAEGLSSRPGECAQVVPLALHDYPSINTYLFSNTPVWASGDRAISGNRAIQEQWQICPKRKDSSTPAHDWIDNYETKAASLSAEVSEAKAVAGILQPPTIQSDSGRRSPTPTSAHTSRGGLGVSIKWTSSGIVQEAEAQREARRRAPPPPIPTHTFYGAFDTALH
ncbi:hypothetical protein B0H14DRAFT_2608191 [Mycena olivaceomarginata]|nr:hypothetical protein B0H14DRAFT_2608191 [Mycena olivaceomarginata]